MSGNSIWIGIDPSYTRTGLVKVEGNPEFSSIACSGGVYQIDVGMDNAHTIVQEFLKKYNYKDRNLKIAIEYPVMASRSGAVLSVLQAKFDSAFRYLSKHNRVEVYYIPSVAIPSFTKIKGKKKRTSRIYQEEIQNKPNLKPRRSLSYLIYKIAEASITGEYKNKGSLQGLQRINLRPMS